MASSFLIAALQPNSVVVHMTLQGVPGEGEESNSHTCIKLMRMIAGNRYQKLVQLKLLLICLYEVPILSEKLPLSAN